MISRPFLIVNYWVLKLLYLHKLNILMNKKEALGIAEDGAKYLINQIREDSKFPGEFIYQRNDKGEIIKGKYNILRHFGCIWAIKNFLFTNNSLQNLDIVNAFKKVTLACRYPKFYTSHKDLDKLFVLDKGFAKLGGNALAILAFEAPGPNAGADKITPLVNGLKFFMSEKGKVIFYKFNPETKIISPFISDYYPGEAVFALAKQREYELAVKMVDWIMEEKYKGGIIHDHWLLQGMDELWNKSRLGITYRIAIKKYATQIANKIKNEPILYRDRNTPTACRVEGLISYYNITGDESIIPYIEELLDELSQYQCKNPESLCYGAFIDKGIYQIDYTQHSLMAFLRYSKLIQTC